MASRKRLESTTGIYHIMHRGNNKESIFREDYVKGKMRKFIRESLEKNKVEIYAYCIMSNHLHMLLRGPLQVISDFVHDFAINFALYYNWKYERVGHVFQGPFLSECIADENYFWQCMQYIHLNPVKVGMARTINEYIYSSAYEYFTGKQNLLDEKAFKLSENRYKNYQGLEKMHQQFCGKVFVDLPEDEMISYKIVAEHYIWMVAEKYKLETIKLVVDTPRYRNEVKKMLRENTNVSRNKANVILNQVISGNDQVVFEK